MQLQVSHLFFRRNPRLIDNLPDLLYNRSKHTEGRTAYACIRCKACGKTYDSREGFCPKCGAYNRPPRREWVDAGGDVHYAGQEKECYERKECHEEKVCYENQTRRPRPHIRRPAAGKSPSSAVTFIAVAVAVIVLFAVLRGVSGDIFDRNEPMPDYDWSTPEYVGEAVASAREYAEMGECFTLEGGAFVVAYTELDHENLSLLAYVVEEGDYQTFPDLIWVDDDGFENWCYPEDVVVSDTDDNVFICTYDLSPMEELTEETYLLFSGMDKEVVVPVDLAQW